MTFRRTWSGVEWRAPMVKEENVSDCSREAWNAPNGIEGFVVWTDGGKNKLNYTRYLDGAERKVDHIELDGERFERVVRCRDCKYYDMNDEPSEVYPDRYWCDRMTVYILPDWFCSEARKVVD